MLVMPFIPKGLSAFITSSQSFHPCMKSNQPILNAKSVKETRLTWIYFLKLLSSEMSKMGPQIAFPKCEMVLKPSVALLCLHFLELRQGAMFCILSHALFDMYVSLCSPPAIGKLTHAILVICNSFDK